MNLIDGWPDLSSVTWPVLVVYLNMADGDDEVVAIELDYIFTGMLIP